MQDAEYGHSVRRGMGSINAYTTGGKVQFFSIRHDAGWSYKTSAIYLSNVWYHIVYTQVGAGAKFYVDGIDDTIDDTDPGLFSGQSGQITINDPEIRAARDIDEFCVWDRNFAAEEVAALANYGDITQSPWSADLLFASHFDSGIGTTVVDYSGNGHDGVFATGTPTWITSTVAIKP